MKTVITLASKTRCGIPALRAVYVKDGYAEANTIDIQLREKTPLPEGVYDSDMLSAGLTTPSSLVTFGDKAKDIPLGNVKDRVTWCRQDMERLITVSAAQSDDEHRPLLHGVYYDKSKFVATTGTILLVWPKAPETKHSVLIHSETVKVLKMLLSNYKKDFPLRWNVTLYEKGIVFEPEDGSIHLVSKLEGTYFPRYENIIPASKPSGTWDAEAFKKLIPKIKAVYRANHLVNAGKHTISLIFDKESGRIKHDETVLDTAFPFSGSGLEGIILDAMLLSAMPSGKVTPPESPGKPVRIDSPDGMTGLIMPRKR